MISFTLLESGNTINFTLTYGIHKDLQEYLAEEERLFKIFIDTEIADKVLELCLSVRDPRGEIIAPFEGFNELEASKVVELLDYVFEYFTEFFFRHQEMIQTTLKNITPVTNS